VSASTGHLKYVNHLGDSFETSGFKLFLQDNELMDYDWNYSTTGTKVTKFSRKPKEYKVPLTIHTDTAAEGIELRNELYELAEKDVLAIEPGRLYLFDYYLVGYITGASSTNVLTDAKWYETELIFVAEDSVWRKDTVITIDQSEIPNTRQQIEPTITGRAGSTPVALSDGIVQPEYKYDYTLTSTYKSYCPQYDYPHDYIRTIGKASFINDCYTDADFLLVIEGMAQNPIVTIGGHQYSVNTIVLEGERLEIDSRAKTVKKIGRSGDEENLFNSRGKAQSIFQKIPAGSNSIIWPGTYGISLTIYDERSMPRWTAW
jgi:hypothetical protein